MQLLKPKFKFALFLTEQAKTSFQQKNRPSQNPVICYAESYEIKEDGSIIFYQTMSKGAAGAGDSEKIFKVPVLAYPQGKWESCGLVDDNDEFPVFNNRSRSLTISNNQGTPARSEDSPTRTQRVEDPLNKPQMHSAPKDEVAELDNMFGTNILSGGGGNNNYQQNGILSMPGVGGQNNTEEFKKQKEEWLEAEIKNYVKSTELFLVEEFITSVKNHPQYRNFKPQETEIQWACSKLIRNKQVMAKKFYNPLIQKPLSLIAPDIMKRQWDGKMAPILQTLQDKEETKNINAIDLAVWMVQNNFSAY